VQVLKESKFKEHGRITPGMFNYRQTTRLLAYFWTNHTEEFVAAGDFLVYKFPVWTWYASLTATLGKLSIDMDLIID
jgi:ubiquitin-like-conjugating enzyme ATG3